MAGRTYRLVIAAFVALGLLAGCGSAREEKKVTAGKSIYISQCSHCHQENGEGFANTYPPLAGNPIVMLHDPEPTITTVLHGRDAMPSYYDTLTVEERAQVISYIRQAWGNNASTINTSQAQ
jgi:mono/diheme cytochrome c family protein